MYKCSLNISVPLEVIRSVALPSCVHFWEQHALICSKENRKALIKLVFMQNALKRRHVDSISESTEIIFYNQCKVKKQNNNQTNLLRYKQSSDNVYKKYLDFKKLLNAQIKLKCSSYGSS